MTPSVFGLLSLSVSLPPQSETSIQPSSSQQSTAGSQPRAIQHQADGGQGLGFTMAGMLLAFQLAHRSNRSLYTDWPMFSLGFSGEHSIPSDFHASSEQTVLAWTWDYHGPNDPKGTAARLAKADSPELIRISGDDLSVGQVQDAWRDGVPRPDTEEEETFKDLNTKRFFEQFQPTEKVQAAMDTLGSHEYVVHIRVGDGGIGCVGDCRINLKDGFSAVEQAILSFWRLSGEQASQVLLLSDSAEVYAGLQSFTQPSWGRLTHTAMGASASEEEQTWAEWLAMTNATEIIHTPSSFSSMAAKAAPRLANEYHLCAGGETGITVKEPHTCDGLFGFLARYAAFARATSLVQSQNATARSKPQLHVRNVDRQLDWAVRD
tara:strand:- start:181 stop:1311 length:1131 start_codon:yes stop_codon:yes gene_type:complete